MKAEDLERSAAPARGGGASRLPRGLREAACVALVAGLWWLAFACGLASGRWSFLTDQQLAGGFWLLALCGALFVPAARPGPRQAAALLLVAQGALLGGFLGTLDGGLLFSDDHSSFFYRLHVLDRQFPTLVAYDVGWNAGRLTTDLFPTGAILFYLLAAPVLALVPLEQAYTALVGVLLVVLAPWSTYAASRLLGLGERTSVAAAVVALAPSLLLTRWALKYGALPFVLTAYLAPLVWALAVRTAREPGAALRFAVPLGACLTASMLWSGSAFLLAPVGAAALAVRGRPTRVAGWLRLAAVAGAVLAVNSVWVVQYLSLVPALRFLDAGATFGEPPAPMAATAGAILATLWGNLQKTSPVLLVAAPVALLDRRDRPRLLATAAVALAVFALATLGPFWKRHLELDRMALPASLFLAPVAAAGLARLWRIGASASPVAAAARGLVVALLAVELLAARAYLGNESPEHFQAMDGDVRSLVEEIRRRTLGGRTYVAGFVLHDFSSGHAMALQALAGVPMWAIEHSHRSWMYREPLPEPFRDGPEGLHRFLALLNVDLVVTKDAEWAGRVGTDPEFQEVWRAGRYRLFRFRRFPGSWFLEGAGEVEATPLGLRARLAGDEAVLRFLWQRGLGASPSGAVSPASLDGLDWLRLRAPRGEWVEVRFERP